MYSMLLNTAIFNAIVDAAKAKSARNPAMLQAIERAVYEINRSAYWAFADGVLKIQSTTSRKLYVVDGKHNCAAIEAGAKFCKHAVARRLLQCYADQLAAPVVPAVQVQPKAEPKVSSVPVKPAKPAKAKPLFRPLPAKPASSFTSPRFQVYGFSLQAVTDGQKISFTITNNGERWTDESPLADFKYQRDYGQGVLNALGLRSLYDRLLIEKLLEAGQNAQRLAAQFATPKRSMLAEAAKSVLVHRTPQGYEHVGGIMI